MDQLNLTKDKENAELSLLGVSLIAFVDKLLLNLSSNICQNFFDKKYYMYFFSPLIRTIRQSMDVDWNLEQSLQYGVNT